MVKPFERKEYL